MNPRPAPAVVRHRSSVEAGRDRNREALDELVAQIVAGDRAAWRELVDAIPHHLRRIVRGRAFIARLRLPFQQGAVIAELVRRLEEDNFDRLKMFTAARRIYPQLRFVSFLRILTKGIVNERKRA